MRGAGLVAFVRPKRRSQSRRYKRGKYGGALMETPLQPRLARIFGGLSFAPRPPGIEQISQPQCSKPNCCTVPMGKHQSEKQRLPQRKEADDKISLCVPLWFRQLQLFEGIHTDAYYLNPRRPKIKAGDSGGQVLKSV